MSDDKLQRALEEIQAVMDDRSSHGNMSYADAVLRCDEAREALEATSRIKSPKGRGCIDAFEREVRRKAIIEVLEKYQDSTVGLVDFEDWLECVAGGGTP